MLHVAVSKFYDPRPLSAAAVLVATCARHVALLTRLQWRQQGVAGIRNSISFGPLYVTIDAAPNAPATVGTVDMPFHLIEDCARSEACP